MIITAKEVRKKLILIFLFILLFWVNAFAAEVTGIATWQPNSEDDLAGYKLYQDDVLIKTIPALTETAALTFDADGDYSFYLIAYDEDDLPSDPSDPYVLNVKIPPDAPQDFQITITIKVNP